jgi:hypothetical protein
MTTVKQLIKLLKEYPEDTLVAVNICGYDGAKLMGPEDLHYPDKVFVGPYKKDMEVITCLLIGSQ